VEREGGRDSVRTFRIPTLNFRWTMPNRGRIQPTIIEITRKMRMAMAIALTQHLGKVYRAKAMPNWIVLA
jgi:hypothetical protein